VIKNIEGKKQFWSFKNQKWFFKVWMKYEHMETHSDLVTLFKAGPCGYGSAYLSVGTKI
jgi:hypothetical protein